MQQTGFVNLRAMVAVVGLLLLLVSMACKIGPKTEIDSSIPVVSLSQPRNKQILALDEAVLITSQAVDDDGIQRVELWIDGSLVRVDVNPDVTSPYVVSQTWLSDKPGTHTIVVKAFDANNIEGQSKPVVVGLNTDEGLSPLPETPSGKSQPSITPSKIAFVLTPTATGVQSGENATRLPEIACTPPPCKDDESYYCPDECPGGCGTRCATPTKMSPAPSFDPTGIETHPSLAQVWNNTEVKPYLGYPISEASDDRRYARQYFDTGYLYWGDQPDGNGLIWVVEIPESSDDHGFRWTGPYQDQWDGENQHSCDEASDGRYGPVSGFGHLWCQNPDIAQAIGDAEEPERGTGESTYFGVIQLFQGGSMLYSPIDDEVWVLFSEGTWRRFSPEE